MKKLASWGLVIAAIGGGYYWLSTAPRTLQVVADVVLPEYSPLAARGEAVFEGTCAACHGVNMMGTENGPSLLVQVYRPSIHADFAIMSAIKNGVAAHHGRFPSMPPQDDITGDQVAELTAYIRELQAANGIN